MVSIVPIFPPLNTVKMRAMQMLSLSFLFTVAATDGQSNSHNASGFEPIRAIHKDIKNKYSNKSMGQANNKKSVSPSPSVASSGSSTNSGNKNSSNKNNGNKNNNSNRNNTKNYNGNTMQSMNTHRINNVNSNIPTTPTVQQSRFCNRLRYMDQQKSHQFSEQNAQQNSIMGTLDCYNIFPSAINPNFLSNVPPQKLRYDI